MGLLSALATLLRIPRRSAVLSPEPADSGGNAEASLTFARDLLVETREEVVRADTKAEILLAGAGVFLGVVVTSTPHGVWSSHGEPPWLWLWWAGVVLTVGAVGSLLMAVVPRTSHRDTPSGRVYFFGDVVRLGNRNALTSVLAEGSDGGSFDRTVDQIWAISRIVSAKYRFIRLAVWLAAAGGLLLVAALIHPH